MHITLSLVLPRDESSIPVVRHICAKALAEICTEPDTVSDIEIAVTEACANVVEHSGPGDDYGVDVTIDDTKCVIRVADNGRGIGAAPHADDPLELTSEGGRGVRLMRALVDKVHFESRPQEGTVVCLEKELSFSGTTAITAASAGAAARSAADGG